MSMAQVRRMYGVPAMRGGRVEYTGCGQPEQGVITGSDGARLRIRLDGHKHSHPFHPRWKLRYLEAAKKDTK
ncbi:hypothetical protein [Comamonas sp. HJ-2]